MRAPLRLLFAVSSAAVLTAGAAKAGETQCWYENGAVIVAASFGDIAGDFILDSTAPQSLLHEDRAAGDGIADPLPRADLIIAGERLRGFEMKVANMNEQEVGFPTTINGVIGADVLRRFVVQIDFAPCRVAFLTRAPKPDPVAARLKVKTIGGVPAIVAEASDGTHTRPGLYAIDTASAGIRLVAAETSFSRPLADKVDPTLRFRPPARLRALSFAAQTAADLPAGTLEYDLPGLKGAIGDAVWSRYRMTLDLKRGRLELAPAP